MPASTLILSDLHLGRPRGAARGARALRPLWQGCTRLVLNGDVAELHHPDHRVPAAREAMALIDLCERDGVDVTVLSGNHDPFISDHRCLELACGQVFVTHGDVFHPAVAPWSPNAGRMREAHDRALSAFTHETRSTLEARLRASQHASHVEWADMERQALHSTLWSMLTRPWALVRVLHYWHIFPDLAAEFMTEHGIGARILVCGHTHHAGVWERKGRSIINTGSFGFPGRPLAVTVDDVAVRAWSLIEQDGLYRRGDMPLATLVLDPVSQPRPVPSATNTRDVSERLSAAAT